jgi:crossover junction endodeoxyribonuclease RuvC
MRVLGIDPGTQCTGYGVISDDGGSLQAIDWGVIKTSSRKPFPQRLNTIYSELKKVIESHRPEIVAVENVFFANNVKTALILGQARGAAILAASNMGLPVEEYSALQIKQAVAGYGRADKDQVGKMVCALLGLPSEIGGGDAADALAAAICHIHSAALMSLRRAGRSAAHGHRK